MVRRTPGWVKRTGTNKEGGAGHRSEPPEVGTRPGSIEEAQITILLDCSLGGLPGLGGILIKISGQSSEYVSVLGIHGQAVLLTVFLLLGNIAPAEKEALGDITRSHITTPSNSCHSLEQPEQAQSPAPIQVQDLHK